MKLRHLAWGLLALLWAVPSFSEDGPRGDEGLQHKEILAARSVSRSVFAAQRAERREAGEAGLPDLARELRRVRDSFRRLRALETVTPRVQVAGEGAPAEVVGLEAQRQQRREARAVPFRRACEGVSAKADLLREKLATLRAPRQRALARAVLSRLDALTPKLEQAAAEATNPGATSLDALAEEIGALDDALAAEGAPVPDPTLVTRTRHRREIPRVP